MSIRWDNSFAGDVQIADGWEHVSLSRQNSDGTFAAPITPIFALRAPANKRTAAGLMEGADVVFTLDAVAGTDPEGTATVAVPDVRPGDRITDYAGAVWSVISATLEGAFDQWRCPCVKVPA